MATLVRNILTAEAK